MDKKRGDEDRGIRLGRRHVRHLDHRDRGGGQRASVRGARDEWRHVPRRRGFRHAHHRVPDERVPKGERHRHPQGSARNAAPQGSLREGKDRTEFAAADRGQFAIHHGGRQRSEASEHQAHARQAGIAGRRPHRADDGSLQDCAQRCGPQGRRDRRRHTGRRPDAHAQGAGER